MWARQLLLLSVCSVCLAVAAFATGCPEGKSPPVTTADGYPSVPPEAGPVPDKGPGTGDTHVTPPSDAKQPDGLPQPDLDVKPDIDVKIDGQPDLCSSPYRCNPNAKKLIGSPPSPPPQKYLLEQCNPQTGAWSTLHDCSSDGCACVDALNKPAGSNYAECSQSGKVCGGIHYDW